nr:reverse transcriptase domain-containing protein [Tanacetum cinerariifolium]
MKKMVERLGNVEEKAECKKFKNKLEEIIMVNVIPPDHMDDVPVVELNQHDDVHVVPKTFLVDEDEDPEEEEFEEEEEPQEEDDDMEVDIEEDENELELTYPYEEVDPLNPPSPASESEPKDVTEDSDGLLPGLIRRDINSLFGQMAHALVKKKGKPKDEYYGKLILELGNEVRSSVEQGTAAMKKMVKRLGNVEEKAECKKFKNKLEEVRIMPQKSTPLTQAAIRRMIKESVDVAIAAEVKIDAYIWGLTDNIKGEVSFFKPANLNEAVRMAHKLMEQKSKARDKRIIEGKKRKWENYQSGNSSGQQEEVGDVRGQAYAIKDDEPQGPNVVTDTFLLNNCYAFVLFDSSIEWSFVDTRFSYMLNINLVNIRASYEIYCRGCSSKKVVTADLQQLKKTLVNRVC